MAAFNHNLAYRPVRCGIAVLNPIVNKLGTIGFLATRNNVDRWIVSCYHVLCRMNQAAFNDKEPIYQPVDSQGMLVARNSIQCADAVLDCAGAEIDPGVQAVGAILGIGSLGGVAAPKIGMHVIKSGMSTGITEGVVTQINGNDIEIGIVPSFSQTYELIQEGDSGALWVEIGSKAPVAMHRGGIIAGPNRAFATDVSAILTSLNLTIVT